MARKRNLPTATKPPILAAHPGESGAIAHSELSNGPDTIPPQETSHSYETAGPVRSSEESGAIAHSELSNGPETIPPQEASRSYETADPVRSSEESGAIAHSELSNGPETPPTQDAFPQLRNRRFLAALLGNPKPLLTQN